MNVPKTFFANSFRNLLGNGLTSPANDGDGYYVAFIFDEPKPYIGGSFHLGADWNGEGGGDTDLGDPVYWVHNGTVVSIVSNQGSATTGFGNYIVPGHDIPEQSLINGQSVTRVHSLYAHLDTVPVFEVEQQIEIGTQIGMLGISGYADVPHLHLEITIGSVWPTSDEGYHMADVTAMRIAPIEFFADLRDVSTLREIVAPIKHDTLDGRHNGLSLEQNSEPDLRLDTQDLSGPLFVSCRSISIGHDRQTETLASSASSAATVVASGSQIRNGINPSGIVDIDIIVPLIGSDYRKSQGSGVVLGANVVLTAGHVVFDDDGTPVTALGGSLFSDVYLGIDVSEGLSDVSQTRCLIPWFDGAILSQEWKEALWDRFVTGAPRLRTPSEQQYSDRKLRSRS